MPMDFPDMRSLKLAAKIHKFRKPLDGESEDNYRSLLADHVAPRDFIESEEIRNKVGWDQWDNQQKTNCVIRKMGPEPNRKDGEPCSHPGCAGHISHPCEVCFRIAARGEYNPKKYDYFL